MVATDVASRGIGMITNTPSPLSFFLFCPPFLRRTYLLYAWSE